MARDSTLTSPTREAMCSTDIHNLSTMLANVLQAEGSIPRRRPTAVVMTASSMRKPKEEKGGAFSHAPLSFF